MALHTAGKRRPQDAEMERILAIGLLGAAPGGVAEKVDADAAEEIAAERAKLAADDVTDPFLQVSIQGGAARHRTGKVVAPAMTTPRGPSLKRIPGMPSRGTAPATQQRLP